MSDIVVEGPGVVFDRVPTVEELAEATDLISIEGATEPASLTDQIALMVPAGAGTPGRVS